MPFDPALPQEDTLIDAAQMRGQLNGLKALIDANVGITAVQVDGVVTVAPGDPATVTATIVGTVLHLSFALPQGMPGLQGIQGQPGNPGSDGATGPQGPPFANIIIDAVNTLPAGQPASVSMTIDGANVHLTFNLPAGADGAPGAPGEVTAAALDAAIADTSANSNAVGTMDTPFANDPPTLADLELIRAKYNELVIALRRA